MNKRRLLKLADLLEADAKNRRGIKFDISDWGTVRDINAPTSCGTTACAMGLAALSGAFKRAGLGYKAHLSDFDVHWLSITFDGQDGAMGAAQALFSIEYEDAYFLFMPGAYGASEEDFPTGASGERRVAKRIRDFVAGKARP